MPAVFTFAPLPNITPAGLISITWPFAFSVPRICDSWPPVTRFRATALLPGCTNCTVWFFPISKLFQLVTIPCVFWFTVIWLPLVLILPWPATICPPVGSDGFASAIPGSRLTISPVRNASGVRVPSSLRKLLMSDRPHT